MKEENTNYEEISREGLIDMLEECEERLEEKSARIRDLKTRLAETERKHTNDRFAFLAALGDAIPVGYDSKLTDGTEPVNYLARHLGFEMTVLKEKNEGLMLDNAKRIKWLEHIIQSEAHFGEHDVCPTCKDIIADFLQRLKEPKP